MTLIFQEILNIIFSMSILLNDRVMFSQSAGRYLGVSGILFYS